MATITYAYAVGATVYYVDGTSGIKEAIVSSITISISVSGTTINYFLSFKNAVFGSQTTNESNIYPDIDSALVAYGPLVTQY